METQKKRIYANKNVPNINVFLNCPHGGMRYFLKRSSEVPTYLEAFEIMRSLPYTVETEGKLVVDHPQSKRIFEVSVQDYNRNEILIEVKDTLREEGSINLFVGEFQIPGITKKFVVTKHAAEQAFARLKIKKLPKFILGKELTNFKMAFGLAPPTLERRYLSATTYLKNPTKGVVIALIHEPAANIIVTVYSTSLSSKRLHNLNWKPFDITELAMC